MISGRSLAAAMLFSASEAIPPVSPPSPMTATTWPFSPGTWLALARPSAQPSAVEACLCSLASCSVCPRLQVAWCPDGLQNGHAGPPLGPCRAVLNSFVCGARPLGELHGLLDEGLDDLRLGDGLDDLALDEDLPLSVA